MITKNKEESSSSVKRKGNTKMYEFYLNWRCESGFQMTVEKPKPKQLLRPIITGAGSPMNQSQFLAINCNSLEARKKSRVHGAIGFCFDSHRLKNWRESFKPVTKRSNRVITLDSHLKTALIVNKKSHSLILRIRTKILLAKKLTPYVTPLACTNEHFRCLSS